MNTLTIQRQAYQFDCSEIQAGEWAPHGSNQKISSICVTQLSVRDHFKYITQFSLCYLHNVARNIESLKNCSLVTACNLNSCLVTLYFTNALKFFNLIPLTGKKSYCYLIKLQCQINKVHS